MCVCARACACVRESVHVCVRAMQLYCMFTYYHGYKKRVKGGGLLNIPEHVSVYLWVSVCLCVCACLCVSVRV
jgi:hypothetical protein